MSLLLEIACARARALSIAVFPSPRSPIALTFNIFALHCRRVLYKGCLNRAIFRAGPAFISLRSPCLFTNNRMKTLQMREL
ncbi:hypothetical protein QUA27_26185 [Microcoleus sp. Pol14C6]|uniref:hypothetical protein n=1 Tax=unclassified Microcoleus TaxID=2642155 RepID=UPI002FD1759F